MIQVTILELPLAQRGEGAPPLSPQAAARRSSDALAGYRGRDRAFRFTWLDFSDVRLQRFSAYTQRSISENGRLRPRG